MVLRFMARARNSVGKLGARLLGESCWVLVLCVSTVRCLSDIHVLMSREPWIHRPGARAGDLA